MVCADDTMIAGDWVDVASEECVDAPLTDSIEKKREIDANNEKEERLSLVLRSQRQKEAQLAFLKEQGLVHKQDEDMVIVNNILQEDSPSLDGTIVEDEPSSNVNVLNEDDPFAQAMNAARKAGVAAAGGALVAVGAVLTPLPTPGGILLAGAGLGVLSTEFECAKKALDTGKEKLVGLIDSIPEKQNTELVQQESVDSFDDDISAVSEDTNKLGSNHPKSADLRTSVQDKARSIGQSIRPFLTDEDAPKRAMDDLNASTKRVLGSAKGKLNEFVAYALVLDYEAPPVELTTLAATAPSPFGGGGFLSSGMTASGFNNMQTNVSNSSEDSSLLQEAMALALPNEDQDTELGGEKVKELSIETPGQESAHVERLAGEDPQPKE